MLKTDALMRYRAVARILQHIDKKDLTVLDVGGGSGHLAGDCPGYRFVAVDTAPTTGLPAVRATGAALPFADRSFDVSLSLDTLEHVAPSQRPAFLAELQRVARRAVLLTAPFDTPGVNSAESCIDSLHRDRHGEGHPWLKEHLAHERPALTETKAAFQPRAVHVEPLGHLPLWHRLQRLDLQLGWRPGGGETAAAIDRAYLEVLSDLDRLEPCYRHLLAVRVDGGPGFEAPEGDSGRFLDALLEFERRLETFLYPGGEGAEPSDVPDGGRPVDRELLQSYRQALDGWEETYAATLQLAEEGHRWRSEFLARRSVRILRRVLRLFGQDL